MAFTACFVFQQELRIEIHLLSSVTLLFDCSGYFPLTDEIQIQSHRNTVLRDQKNQTSEWVSVTGIGLVPLSLITWHLSTAAPWHGRAVFSVPQLLWEGQSCLCCCLCEECPSLLPGGKWTIESQQVEGLFLLSSCVGTAWLQARAACTRVGKLSAYWCWTGRAGLFY